MGPIDQFSVEVDKILVEYLDKMIREKKIHPSCGFVVSAIYFVPKPNVKGFRLCGDYTYFNDHQKNDKTTLPMRDQ